MHSRSFAAGAALVVPLVLAACSGNGQKPPAATSQAATAASAEGDGHGHHPHGGGHHRHGPPPEATEACSGKAAKDACTVTMHGRTLNGTCAAHGGDKLICAPAPPQAIFDACNGKASGDACSVTFGERGGFSGKCGAGFGASDGKLGCQPEGGPGGPHGRHGPPPEAFTACEGKSAEAACSIATPRGNLDGTCSAGPGGDKLACRPKGPPPGGPSGPPPGGPGGPPGGPGGPPPGPPPTK